MLNNIVNKVKSFERRLEKVEEDGCKNDDDDSIMVISTFGRDQVLTETTKNIEKRSETMKFRYVKKTGPIV